MFKYSILLLISLTTLAGEPKFHFMDCVRITEGFYKGCKGNVKNYLSGSATTEPSYTVSVDDCKNNSFYDDFYENQLEACKK
jgi:hypothetical protein